MTKTQTQKNELARRDPVFFAEEFLGMPLHKGQKKYLRACLLSFDNPHGNLIRRFVLVCANRWGKSALIAILQLWYLYFKFGVNTESAEDWFDVEYRTANIAPFSSLTEPVFMAMRAIMTSTYPVRDPVTGIIRTNQCQIEPFFLEDRTINTPPYKLYFANNAYIEHLSLMGGKGDNLQGKPYGIITYDEATRSDHLEMELDNSILGRLLDWRAPLHLIGTPDQDGNSLLYIYDIYKDGLVGLNQTYTQEGSIYENLFMTRNLIAEQEKLLEGNPLRDQMLHGKFIFGTQNVFQAQHILGAEDDSLNDGLPYLPGHKYTVGIDTAIGSDEFVTTILDTTEKPYRIACQDAVKGNARSPQMHIFAVSELLDRYRDGGNIEMVVETWNGESARFFQDLPPYIRAFTHTYGSWQPSKVRTSNKNPSPNKASVVKKADIIVSLAKVLAAGELKIPKQNQQLVKQLSIYKEDDKKIPTDRVISLALAVWLAEENVRKNRVVELIEM